MSRAVKRWRVNHAQRHVDTTLRIASGAVWRPLSMTCIRPILIIPAWPWRGFHLTSLRNSLLKTCSFWHVALNLQLLKLQFVTVSFRYTVFDMWLWSSKSWVWDFGLGYLLCSSVSPPSFTLWPLGGCCCLPLEDCPSSKYLQRYVKLSWSFWNSRFQ